MITLKETLDLVRKLEKTKGVDCILYRVYENSELIYVGIGGISARKPSGRLAEHYAPYHYSSFKHNYMIDDGWKIGVSFKERLKDWNSLKWEFETGNVSWCQEMEKKIKLEHRPKYNKDVPKVNENVFKFIDYGLNIQDFEECYDSLEELMKAV